MEHRRVTYTALIFLVFSVSSVAPLACAEQEKRKEAAPSLNAILDQLKGRPTPTPLPGRYPCNERGVKQALGDLTALGEKNGRMQTDLDARQRAMMHEVELLMKEAAANPGEPVDTVDLNRAAAEYTSALEERIALIKVEYMPIKEVIESCSAENLPTSRPLIELRRRSELITRALSSLEKQPAEVKKVIEQFTGVAQR